MCVHSKVISGFSPKKKKLTPKRRSRKKEDEAAASEKHSSEYPGPSNRMKKTGLPKIVSTSPDGRGIPASPQRPPPPKNQVGCPTKSPKKRKRMSFATEQKGVIKKQKMSSPNSGTVESESFYPTLTDDCNNNNLGKNKDVGKRLSLEDFKDVTKDKKKSLKKKKSLEPVGSQKTLEGWLKLGTFKPRDKSPQNLDSDEKKISTHFTKRTPVKRPSVIEWKGIQLLIKSPRVLLRKNVEVSGNLKPRSLDLNKVKDSSARVPNITGKALLADLDNDFRVTRNMVSVVDSVCSYDSNDYTAEKYQNLGTQSRRGRKRENKRLLSDWNDDLSEDELTPKSREILLRSSGKKEQPVPDLELSPDSRVLRSSGKKKQAVSNLDSKNFWTLSNDKEPLTPTGNGSNQFFPLKGVLDENCNKTPNSKSKSDRKNIVHDSINTPSAADKKVFADMNQGKTKKTLLAGTGSEQKYKSPVAKNSPVTRSASKLGSCKVHFNQQEVVAKKTLKGKLSPELMKATRSLSQLYADKNERQISKNIQNTLDEKESKEIQIETEIDIPIQISSIRFDSDEFTLQLTPPKSSTCSQDFPPKIKKSSKSLSELKSFKCTENDASKMVTRRQKIKRKSESSIKTSSPSLKSSCVKESFRPLVKNDSLGSDGKQEDQIQIVAIWNTAECKGTIVKLHEPASKFAKSTSEHKNKSGKSPRKSGRTSLVDSSVLQIEQKSVTRETRGKTEDKGLINSISEHKYDSGKNTWKSGSKSLIDSPVFKIVTRETVGKTEDKGLTNSTLEPKYDNGKNTRKSGPTSLIDSPFFKSVARETQTEQKGLTDSPVFKTRREKTGINDQKSKTDSTVFESKNLPKTNTTEDKAVIIMESPGFESKNAKSVNDNKVRSSPRFRNENAKTHLTYMYSETLDQCSLINTEKQKTLQNSKSVSKYDEEKPNAENRILNNTDIPCKNSAAGTADSMAFSQFRNGIDKYPVAEESSSKDGKVKKITRSVKILDKSKVVNNVAAKQLQTSQEELKTKYISSVCENTCPNAQPLLNKSPRQGATYSERVPPPVMFGSVVGSKAPGCPPDVQGAKTVSPGLRSSDYYANLLASYARVGKKTVSPANCSRKEENKESQSMVSPLLKIKPTAHPDKNKVTLTSLAEQMEKSADNFHTLSRSSSRSSDEYSSTCPVGLSLSPSYVTRFRRSQSDSVEEKQVSGKNGSIDLQSVPAKLVELVTGNSSRLIDETDCNGGSSACLRDIMSDKLAMSEYYSTESQKSHGSPVQHIDMDDIRPLTDITS